MHRHGAYAILLSSLAGTFAASCYPDRCLNTPTPTSTVIETIAPSSPTIGPSKTPSSTVPTSSGDSLPTGTASLKTSRTGVVSSSVLLSTPAGGPSSTTGQTTASTTTDSVPVLLTVVPAILGPPTRRKRRFFGGRGVKRQDAAAGGFIDVVGTVETCSDGTPFNITTEGQLTSDGRAVGARFGDIFIPLAPRDDGIDISTEFVVVDSVLHWQNAAFSGGEARFCQVGGGSGQVYATFAERDTWPPDCDSISIIVYKGKMTYMYCPYYLLG
ncbi:hypothetical protein PG991_015349 [Apiospora marii]|uniref:DUF7908 domain-containing protein n=1 Tax=Apiospora marii TaxID=335849 RepID=A0ABR1R380_9PEZI